MKVKLENKNLNLKTWIKKGILKKERVVQEEMEKGKEPTIEINEQEEKVEVEKEAKKAKLNE